MSKIIVMLFLMFTALVFVQGVAISQDETIQLEEMQIDTERITLSGFSAGSTMATQMHISHSSIFSGVALFSQAYYRCGPTSIIDFGLHCTRYPERLFPNITIARYDVQKSVDDARRFESEDRIDALSNLAKQRVFVWTGEMDDLIPYETALENIDFYSNFIPAEQLISTTNDVAGHLYPSDSYGNDCAVSAKDTFYVGNCGYSGAYESIRYILGEQIQKPQGEIQLSPLKVFDQTEFFEGDDITVIGMGTQGLLYIPEACYTEKCLLHFHFHGCDEGAETNGSLARAQSYVEHNGLLEMAEINKIIVVYPLTIDHNLLNNNGCWDFFQYSGFNFSTRNGRQIKVIRRMFDRLAPSLLITPTPTPPPQDSGSSTRSLNNLFVIFSFLLTIVMKF